MKITFLGTGTSSGIPLVACECPVCTDAKRPGSKNNRMRCSLFIEYNDKKLLVDCGQDFRQQALRFNIKKIDAVYFTHAHADHSYGIPDIRTYNAMYDMSIPCYANSACAEELEKIYWWIFQNEGKAKGPIPRLTMSRFDTSFELFGKTLIPLHYLHGNLPVAGLRIGDFSYVTDVSHIPEETFTLLKGTKVLVISALQEKPHPTHFSISQAIETAQRVGAEKTYFTHMNHSVDHYSTELPSGIEFAFDGLELEL